MDQLTFNMSLVEDKQDQFDVIVPELRDTDGDHLSHYAEFSMGVKDSIPPCDVNMNASQDILSLSPGKAKHRDVTDCYATRMEDLLTVPP